MVNPNAPFYGAANRNQYPQTAPNVAPSSRDPTARSNPAVKNYPPPNSGPIFRNITMLTELLQNTATSNMDELRRIRLQDLARVSQSIRQWAVPSRGQTTSSIHATSQQQIGELSALGVRQARNILNSPQNQPNQNHAIDAAYPNTASESYNRRVLNVPTLQRGNPSSTARPDGSKAPSVSRALQHHPGTNFPFTQNQSHVNYSAIIRSSAQTASPMGITTSVRQAQCNVTFSSNAGGYHRATNVPSKPQWGDRLASDIVGAVPPNGSNRLQQHPGTNIPVSSRDRYHVDHAAGTGHLPTSRESYLNTVMRRRMMEGGYKMSTDDVNAHAAQESGLLSGHQELMAPNRYRLPRAPPSSAAGIHGGSEMNRQIAPWGNPTTSAHVVNVGSPQMSRQLKRHQHMGIQGYAGGLPESMLYVPAMSQTQNPPPMKKRFTEDFERLPYVPNVEIELTFGVQLPPKPLDIETWLRSCCAQRPSTEPIDQKKKIPFKRSSARFSVVKKIHDL